MPISDFVFVRIVFVPVSLYMQQTLESPLHTT